MSDTLFIIPARGGSKGVPGKNIKPLAGKPLICYSIDIARKFVSDEFICVSTDDDKIAEVVKAYGLTIPFKRPDELATDTAGSSEVIVHALNHYEQKGYKIKTIVLLQPTSPFRTEKHVREAMALMKPEIDMVVGVKKTDVNPYTVLFEEDEKGFLEKIKSAEQDIQRRQDAPVVYQINGAVYIINAISLKSLGSLARMSKKVKYSMESIHSLDIDVMLDWYFAEFLIERKLINFQG